MLRLCGGGMMTGYSSRTYKYFVSPLKSGLMGFSFFFSILMFTKLFGYVFKLNLTFDVDIKDVVISTLGFGLLFLYKLMENFKKERN
jgi:hypothetical protein